MAIERTLSIIKPDAVAKNVIGQIVSRFEGAGLKVAAAKLVQLSQAEAEAFYAVHAARPFFKDLVSFMISGPVFVQVLEGVKEGDSVVVSANFLIDAESNLKAALGGMQKAEEPKAAAAGHPGEGTLTAIDAESGSVTISHQPIASLKWPAMKMDFMLANPSLVSGLKPGAAISFEFVERSPGEWVITSLVKK